VIPMYKIAVIGDKDSILGFKALGVATIPVTSTEMALQTLKKLAREQYGVVFITEQTAEPIQDYIAELSTRMLPSVVMIPNNAGTLGLGIKRMKQNVEKAIGADILFGKEG
jgi:V/A-type H+-transporting ATPase subunit F